MTGQYIAGKLDRRVRIFEKLILMLDCIENEIVYLNRPTARLLETLSENTELAELDFLQRCIALVNRGSNIDDAWEKAVSDSALLGTEDIAVLCSFAEFLGKSDVDGQISNCRYHSELLKERLCRARQSRDRSAAVSRGLGLLTGIGVFIILF